MRFVVHDSAGAIQWVGETGYSADAISAWELSAGLAVLVTTEDVAEQAEWRVVDGAVVRRTAMAISVSAMTIAADGTAEAMLSGLPDPCEVTVMRQRVGAAENEGGVIVFGPASISGGTVTLTSTEAGRLRIAVTAGIAFAPWQGIVDAH